MKAKHWMIGILVIGMVWVTAGSVWAGGRPERRQNRQADRIYHGVRNGTISPQEFKRLGREQFRIEAAKRRALKDGHITRYERRHLNRMQNRAGKRIYRTKHDGRGAAHGGCYYRPARKNHGGAVVRGQVRWND
jgi:hypothetical protein